MKHKPLVSVVIPTFNSQKTLEICLKSVKKQTYQNIEIVVVDNYSQDETVEIARNFGDIVFYKGGILGARYVGFEESRGGFVLLLDSDQILQKSAVKRAVGMMSKYDVLCLEERSYKPRTFIEKLFDADRRLVFELAELHLNPLDGVLLARFYKRQVLSKAFDNIPEELLPIVVAHDHAIIYYETYRISQKVGIISNAMWHIEPRGLIPLWKKNFRYGRSAKCLARTGFYEKLLRNKVRFRKGSFSYVNLQDGMKSCLLLAIKGIIYQIGYSI